MNSDDNAALDAALLNSLERSLCMAQHFPLFAAALWSDEERDALMLSILNTALLISQDRHQGMATKDVAAFFQRGTWLLAVRFWYEVGAYSEEDFYELYA